MVIISAVVCIYYNMIIAWTLHYFFNSFYAELPWSTCNNKWNTPQCLDSKRRAGLNMTNVTLNGGAKWRTPSEEYWEYVPSSLRDFMCHSQQCCIFVCVVFFRECSPILIL